MAWSADSISCVMFTQPQPGLAAPDALQLWQTIFGASPQAYNQLPPAASGSQASGVVGNFLMMLTAQLGRADLTLHPAPSVTVGTAVAPGIFPPAIADAAGALDAIATRARTFVTLGAPSRLAILVNLSKPANGPAETAAEFQRDTGISIPLGSTDLTFAYNCAKKTRDGIPLNRIRRWITGAQQFVVMQINPGVAPALPLLQNAYVTMYQIDVNTAAHQAAAFAPQDVSGVFDQLVAEAKDLMANHSDDHAPPVT
jgi:hypothetical protein